MSSVELRNVSLYYEIYGKGFPLLLIAGLGSDCSGWALPVKDFAKYFRTILFDNRCSGRSNSKEKKFAISNMADDVIQLLDYLNIDKTHIVGYSMGGFIAQEIAIKYPERISKLVLVSTASVISKRNYLLFNEIYKQLKREGNSEAWIKRWAFWLFSSKFFDDKNNIETFARNFLNYPYKQKASEFKSQLDAIASFDSRRKTKKIKAKTLVISGNEDLLITPEESRILSKGISNSKFKILKGVAHYVYIEHPRLFSRTVLEFLKTE